MNQEKAREFFSSYYEGSLEAGLRQTFEQRLKADSKLQEEYSSFEETMERLDTMKFEEIEIPSFLSDRIATRLEEVQDRKAAKSPIWTLWLRGVAFSGLAAAAIFASIVGIRSFGNSAPAGVIDGPGGPELSLKVDGNNVTLQYQAATNEVVTVSSEGKQLDSTDLSRGQKLVSPLHNDQPATALFDVKAGDKTTVIAVPGSKMAATKAGEGSVRDFAAALAGFYRVPVELEVADATQSVVWTFDDSKPIDAANKALQSAHVSIAELDSGVIEVKDR